MSIRQDSHQNFCNWCMVYLCIINDLGGLVNNGCGQLLVSMHELQIHDSCNAEKQSKTKVSQRPADFIG